MLFVALSSFNFQNQQLTKSQSLDNNITNITVAWPRLIAERNDLSSFEQDLQKSRFWQVDPGFLIFREMKDKKGKSFYLIGASNYQTYLKDSGLPVPTVCSTEICEVVAAVSNKDQIPNPTSLGIKVIGASAKAANLPIPKDFGLSSDIPILITPMLTELANYLPTKYLLATYGWQLTPRSIKGTSAISFKSRVAELSANLTTQYPNVAVNYQVNKIDKLISNQERLSLQANTQIKFLIALTFLLLIMLLPSRNRRRWWFYLITGTGGLLLTQLFWGFQLLLQFTLFLVIGTTLLLGMIRLLDLYLVKRDLASLALLRSSFRSIFSIGFLIMLLISISFSNLQFLNRNYELRAERINTVTPFDFTLKVGPNLIKPLDIGSIEEISQLSPGTTALSVIRSTATITDENGNISEVNLLAGPSNTLWNEPAIPLEFGTNLQLRTRGIPPEIDLIIWLRTSSGSHLQVTAQGDQLRNFKLPATELTPLSIVALELKENPDYAAKRSHALGESTGRSFAVLSGTGDVLGINLDGRNIDLGDKWKISNFEYSLENGPNIIRPEFESNLGSIKLSSDFANNDSELLLGGISNTPILLDNYQITRNLTGASKPYLTIDLNNYQKLVGKEDPGAIDPIEIWIKSSSPDAFIKAFKASKFSKLQVIDRSKLELKDKSNPYHIAWFNLLLIGTSFATLLVLSLIGFFYFTYRSDKTRKYQEFTRNFKLLPPKRFPFVLAISLSTFLALPVLYLSRYFAGLLT